jgi:phage tail-like protein
MAVGDRRDPYLGFNFLVEIEGLVVGGFSEVSGLQIEVEVQDYREGGLNEYVHRLAGPTRYPSNLVLERGLTDSDMLWRWHQHVTRGVVERKNGSIVLLDSAREEKWRWNFVGAYPVRWVGPDLRAGTAEAAVETLELVHRGLAKAT